MATDEVRPRADNIVNPRISALDPHDEVDVSVGNALRVANNRFDDVLLGLIPYTVFDCLMHDLCQLGGTDWNLERRKWYTRYPHEEHR